MKEKKVYLCSECGSQSSKWVGKCPQCGAWNSMEAEVQRASAGGQKATAGRRKEVAPSKLLQVQTGHKDRIVTGIHEFDRVMGGGIVRDSVTILTSPPGGGKSTLTLMICNQVASQGMRVLYATGEESDSQIKSRADRILTEISGNIWIVADTSLDLVLDTVSQVDPDLIIIDSIQTFSLQEFYPARAGNPTQTMECAGALVKEAKARERGRAVILIGQMNKSDELAGLRSLEHLVDTVLVMEGENEEELRSVVASKNRFGSTGEMGFFSMTERGMLSLDNPSEFFVTQREEGESVCGSALTVVREGSRPIIAEVESLVSNSFTPYPSRIGEAMRREQLNTLISILEERGGISLFNKNVVIKTTGGIKLREASANLAVIVSIASSVYGKPVLPHCAFIADVGLTGELKRVPSLESRIRELDRMGFRQVYIAKGGVRPMKLSLIEILEFKTVLQVLIQLFGERKK